jgi:hypothetical protein
MLARTFGKETFRINQNKHVLEIINPIAGTIGARFQWISADDPLYSMGYTFSWLGFDESQRVSDEVFYKVEPTTAVRNASILAFGTPDITPEQSWFKGLWLRGQDLNENNIHSFKVSWRENPHITMERVMRARESLSWREFRMLYLAEWAGDDEMVFTNIKNALLPWEPEFNRNQRHIMSVDFAMHDDFNAVMVAETATRTIVRKEKWSHKPPRVTYDRIQNIWEESGYPLIVADTTGLGAPMAAELVDRGMRVRGVNLNNKNKLQMIGKLAGDIEHRRIMFPESWGDLINELNSFVYAKTPTGLLTAKAAAGYHDDLVTALYLVNSEMKPQRSSTMQQYSYIEENDPLAKFRMGNVYA